MTVRKNWGQRKSVPSAVTLPADLEAELDKVRKAVPLAAVRRPDLHVLEARLSALAQARKLT